MDVHDIISRVDIVSYISQFCDLELKPDGEYWACSPLKKENTPSFSVDPNNQVFYDFSSHKGGNVISFIVEYFHCPLYGAVNILKKYAGINEEITGTECPSMIRIAKKYKEKIRKDKDVTSRVFLPENIMDRYLFDEERLRVWFDEGISYDTMKKFSVRYDPFSDRIVFPIRDNAGNIVSICGRTLDPDYKEKKLRKYTYFQPIITTDFLYGYSDNISSITNKKEIILFEGAKSVMKACDWGYDNCCALLTSHLNQDQMRILASLGAKCVFALDEDADADKDENIRMLTHYTNVRIIRNRNGLLSSKMSPVDAGKEVWDQLYGK